MQNYLFIDESGDPGVPYITSNDGKKIATGASLYYIISAILVNSQKLYLLENQIAQIKGKFGYKPEIKSTNISLSLYRTLLQIINSFNVHVYYRFIDKRTYKGVFAVAGKKKLHNVFDEYNLVKTVSFALREEKLEHIDVVIDRAERRLLDGKFDNFDNYLFKKVNSLTLKRVEYVTHVSSEYVYLMQLTDLVSGAIKDFYSGKNKQLKSIIKQNLLRKVW